jgi:hypothetical protein
LLSLCQTGRRQARSAFSPDVNRISMRFTNQPGGTVGSTSVALWTP